MLFSLRALVLSGCICCAATLFAQTTPAPAGGGSALPTEPMARAGKDGVSAPIVLEMHEPEFSEQARKEWISRNVLVYLQVEMEGSVSHVHVIRGVGYGLDKKAVEAVKAYKFKPAMKNGEPVRVEMNVMVNFKVYDRQHLRSLS